MPKGAPDYTKRVELLGVDSSGKLVTVRLDDTGRIEALMKGESDGTFKTLATDDQGRIIAVITDPENIWGVRPTMGNAELAARLGSLSVFDRRGQVVWQDDFSLGLGAWSQWWSGTGGAVSLETGHFRRGGYAAKLTCGSTDEASASISHPESSIYEMGLLGIEAHISFGLYITAVGVGLEHFTGSQRIISQLGYNRAAKKLFVYTQGPEASVIAENINLPVEGRLFTPFKLVVDLKAHRYIRAIVAGVEYDLSDFTPHIGDHDDPPQSRAYISFTGESGKNGFGWVDCVILTVEEP